MGFKLESNTMTKDFLSFSNLFPKFYQIATDGPATINVNIYLRTISRIDDVKMVRKNTPIKKGNVQGISSGLLRAKIS
jgi:hypothetical protein